MNPQDPIVPNPQTGSSPVVSGGSTTQPLSTATTNSSLLQEIIRTANTSSVQGASTPPSSPSGGNTTPPPPPPLGSNTPTPETPPPKKSRDPVSTATILKFIGSILLVAVIFFGSWLGYIAFHPEQARFFVDIFGIRQADLKALLKNLVNGSFGIIVFSFSIVWIITLFRAIWTPKDQKRKRIMNWLLAVVMGIFLFSTLGAWAFIFNKINAANFENIDALVMVYDNDLYANESTRARAEIQNTSNLIGPITLKFDLSDNAKEAMRKTGITIESYEFDADSALCNNEATIIKGSDPTRDKGIICTFDEKKVYNIRGVYRGKNMMGEVQELSINVKPVEIVGILKITQNTNQAGQKVMTIDASPILNLGEPKWIFSTDSGRELKQPSITQTISAAPLLVCFRILPDTNECDRMFMIKEVGTNSIGGSISFTQSPINPLSLIMTLSGVTVDAKEIISVRWLILGNQTQVCKDSGFTCEYVFTQYGRQPVTATIELANGKKYDISSVYTINEPLLLAKHGRIYRQDGTLLSTDETFDAAVGGYVMRNLVLSQKLILDAQDVISENAGYSFKDATWIITNQKGFNEEKKGTKASFEVPKSERYTIEATYTFEKNIVTGSDDIRTARDIFIIDLDRKSLQPIATISSTSDYVPAKVTVDASASYSALGEIKKFTFDFGEGRPPATGDAIQTYQYTTSGEKKVTISIINEAGETASIMKTVVLKDSPKTLGFSTSMSPGVVNMPVDFTGDRSSGQIEEYIWNFGDNTPVSRGYEVSHSFKQAGTYIVTLTVRYSDGTEKSTNQSFKVDATLE